MNTNKFLEKIKPLATKYIFGIKFINFIDNFSFDKYACYNIGGSGSLHCELIKKYGMIKCERIYATVQMNR